MLVLGFLLGLRKIELKTLSIAFLMFISAYSFAADEEGKFAVKGAGKRDCSNFLKAANERNTDLYLYGGWLEGYLSSYNQFQPSNYDVTPWQTTELMLTLLQRHCQNNTDVKFLSAVNSLIKTLYPIRLEDENELVRIDVNGAQTYFYVDILKRAKERLKQLNYIKGEINDKYTKEDAAAFEEYQKAIGLKVTGIPDQYTLASLFLKPKN
jgi:hypothetical protein